MASITLWLLILVIGVGTFALRLSFIQLAGSIAVPNVLERALRYVPAAVLAALVTPALVYADGIPHLSIQNERLLAGGVAAIVAWCTRNVLFTIVAGMAVLWLLQFANV